MKFQLLRKGKQIGAPKELSSPNPFSTKTKSDFQQSSIRSYVIIQENKDKNIFETTCFRVYLHHFFENCHDVFSFFTAAK